MHGMFYKVRSIFFILNKEVFLQKSLIHVEEEDWCLYEEDEGWKIWNVFTMYKNFSLMKLTYTTALYYGCN